MVATQRHGTQPLLLVYEPDDVRWKLMRLALDRRARCWRATTRDEVVSRLEAGRYEALVQHVRSDSPFAADLFEDLYRRFPGLRRVVLCPEPDELPDDADVDSCVEAPFAADLVLDAVSAA